MKQQYKTSLPLIVVLCVIAGIYLGKNYSSQSVDFSLFNSSKSEKKLTQLLDYVDNYYVEPVEKERLVEKAINAITSELDPHSSYISAEELDAYTDPLEGSFSGIGIEFMVFEDTVNILKVVPNGPSEKAGLKEGDKLLKADSTKIAGVNLSNREIISYLKGATGSIVNVKLVRNNTDTLTLPITRGTVEIESVNKLSVIDDVAYIKILRFSKNTDTEFFEELNRAKARGINKVVIDLRNNGGGYLQSATAICEKLLDKGDLIVYTQGKARPKREYFAEGSEEYNNMKFAILINAQSASASEILAGAFQDNDKATIIGTRSFGKGLVQEQLELAGKSAIRLTVAKYYTPSGRCIQRPYLNQDGEHLSDLEYNFQDLDSIETDTTKFFTKNGRVVYGGGGIVPDIKVDEFERFDNNGNYWFDDMYQDGSLQQLCFKFGLEQSWDNFEDFDANFSAEKDFKPFLRQQRPDIRFNNTFGADVSRYIKYFIANKLYEDSLSNLLLLRSDKIFLEATNPELWEEEEILN